MSAIPKTIIFVDSINERIAITKYLRPKLPASLQSNEIAGQVSQIYDARQDLDKSASKGGELGPDELKVIETNGKKVAKAR